MATVIAPSSSRLCPCASPSSFAFSSSAGASSPSRPGAAISSRTRRISAALGDTACCCRREQGSSEQLDSAPFSVPLLPPLLRSTRRRTLLRCPPRAELDSDTILAVGVGVAGLALGIGIPVFYETQVKGSEGRENDQPCFPCNGSGSQICRFCVGAGNITVELGAGEKEVSKCINCEGAGSITCTTCQGSGVQPRYLDRREYKDED